MNRTTTAALGGFAALVAAGVGIGGYFIGTRNDRIVQPSEPMAGRQAEPVAPAPAPVPPAASVPPAPPDPAAPTPFVGVTPAGELDAPTLVAAAKFGIEAGNIGEVERIVAEGRTRFPDQPEWLELEQRLTTLRAERDARARAEQARRMIADARRYAGAADFDAADAMLGDAEGLVPGLPETARARADILQLRGRHFGKLRERRQFVEAIEAAISGFRLWEAEGLVAEGRRRFPDDSAFLNLGERLRKVRDQADWQERVRRATEFVSRARTEMSREQFADAERHLDDAERIAMGLPDIRAARTDLARLRIEADARASEIRQFALDIEKALARNHLVTADRILDFAARRHPSHSGWTDFRRRIAAARAATAPSTAPMVANARRAIAARNWPMADSIIDAAERINAGDPAVRAVRAELNATRAAAARAAGGHVANARAAIAARNLPLADAELARAEAVDPLNTALPALRADLAAAKRSAASPPPPPLAPMVANARRAIAARNWPLADSIIDAAERVNAGDADVRAVRAELNSAKATADRAARTHVANARAAIAAKNLPLADAELARAEAVDPLNPALPALRADLAAAKRSAASPPPPPVAPMVANARRAIAARNWPMADSIIDAAERINAGDPAVRAVRAELNATQAAAGRAASGHVANARAAIAARNLPLADAEQARAEAVDPLNTALPALKADLAAAKRSAASPPPALAPMVANARRAIAARNWAMADSIIDAAERINAGDPAVRAVRAELNATQAAAARAAGGHVANARAAIAARNLPLADAELARAEAVDPLNTALPALKAALAAAKRSAASPPPPPVTKPPAPPPIASPPPPPVAPMVANARRAIAAKNWPMADSIIDAAERINAGDPAVRAVRAELNATQAAAARAAGAHLASARAAIAARNLPLADAELARAEAADPRNAALPALKAALAAAKRSAASPPPPPVAKPPVAPPAASPPPPALAPMLANARRAIAAKNWPIADSIIDAAERINAGDPAVRAVRAELNATQAAAARTAGAHLASARAAIAARDRAAATNAISQAHQADPGNPALVAVVREFKKVWP